MILKIRWISCALKWGRYATPLESVGCLVLFAINVQSRWDCGIGWYRSFGSVDWW
jgi:hypothetical protein